MDVVGVLGMADFGLKWLILIFLELTRIGILPFFVKTNAPLFKLISSTSEIEVGNGLRGLFPGEIKSFSSNLSSLP